MAETDPPQAHRAGGPRREGHSPAGQPRYEEQDGSDVQLVPEVAEVQEGHLPEPTPVRVIQELGEDTWGWAGLLSLLSCRQRSARPFLGIKLG